MLSTDTHMYMGGLFISAGGNVNTEDLTRWNYATEGWETVPGLSPDIGGRVDEIFQKDGDPNIYFGGNFRDPAGTDANGIVRFNPSTVTWEALVDPNFNLANTAWDTGPTNGRVLAVEQDDTFVYVGGNFTNVINGNQATKVERYILRYRLGAGGSVSTGSWERMGAVPSGNSDPSSDQTPGGVVDDLLLLPNGDLIAAVRSTRGLVRWDGSSWSLYAGGVAVGTPPGGSEGGSDSGGPGFVRAMAQHPDGRIFVAGSFSSVGASNLPANFVAAYDPATNTWDNLNLGFGPDYAQSNGTTFNADGVFDLKIDSTGLVYVAGDFQTTTGGTTSDANHVAVWDDSGEWKSLGSGLGSTGSQIANCIGITPEDTVFVGGVFSRGWELSKSASNRVAIWDADEELTVVPPLPDTMEIRIEDGKVVAYTRFSVQDQYRIRFDDELPITTSDSARGPFLMKRFLIDRRELEDFDPAARPRRFYKAFPGL